MGRLTAERENRIYERFKENLSYSKTATEEGVDARTVRRIVEEKTKHAKSTSTGTKDRKSSNSNLLEEKMKILYRELNRGNDPRKIIEEHGFDSDFVMKEHKKSIQFKKQDSPFSSFQGFMLNYFMARHYPELRMFEDIYKDKGALTLDEATQLFNLGIMRILHKHGIPSDWEKLTCKICHRSIAFADPKDQTGARILYEFQNSVHIRCPS